LRSRTYRRAAEPCEQRHPVLPEPRQQIVLAYVLAADRAKRRGQLELASELQACVRALLDRVG
jgi:hypothetical protein